ncbi:hypothetical protein CYMTET_31169 [Cymbomonas tetramitiformis]|uniref:Gingipain domain-containing protein n=1 Tax=Cymbomonas tetramitiformis TaxID=36881 RepID=A0AAE0KTE9_9CHLO|nr:hypothetical protein CYMTET_31169 [Cymbomonas tetramitiformis]
MAREDQHIFKRFLANTALTLFLLFLQDIQLARAIEVNLSDCTEFHLVIGSQTLAPAELGCGQTHCLITTPLENRNSTGGGNFTLNVTVHSAVDEYRGTRAVRASVWEYGNSTLGALKAETDGEGSLGFFVSTQLESVSWEGFYLNLSLTGMYCPAGYKVEVAVVPIDAFKLTFLHIGGVRSRMMPINVNNDQMCDSETYNDDYCIGGVDRRSGFIKSVIEEEENVVTLDAGNQVYGTVYFSRYNGRADAELELNPIPFDVYVPSYSEFFEGIEQFYTLLFYLHHQVDVVLSNVDWSNSILAETALKRYVVKQIGQRQVGFLGYVDDSDWVELTPSLDTEKFVINPSGQGTPYELRQSYNALMEEYPFCNIIVLMGGLDSYEQGIIELLESDDNYIDVYLATQVQDFKTGMVENYQIYYNGRGDPAVVLSLSDIIEQSEP